jgi:zinc D-Ala-D-Ala carboxypeptidase
MVLVAGVLLLTAAVAPAYVYPSLASSSSTSTVLGHGDTGLGPAATAAPRSPRPAAPGGAGGAAVPAGTTFPRTAPPRAPGQADGVLPAGTTVFDRQYPGVAQLDPTLLSAMHKATTDAAGDGVEILVDSGWRSRSYQDRLLEQAISTYGTAKEAARWVSTPDTSAHVTGDAVDIGPAAATRWLAAHGATYGLCQIYGNEPWHYELRPDAIDHGCPPTYADPTQDPRMHT